MIKSLTLKLIPDKYDSPFLGYTSLEIRRIVERLLEEELDGLVRVYYENSEEEEVEG